LGTGTNETLKSNAFNGYIDGFMALYDKDNEEVWKYMAHLNECLAAKVHQDDTYIKENIIEKGEDAVMLFIHGKKLDDITNRFLKDNVKSENKTNSIDSDNTI
jgi:ATP-dependent DNA helicase RecQ